MLVVPGHFVRSTSREEAKALFARSVKVVELEIFTYCNRRCWFCPNATIDRLSANHYMDSALYSRILCELAEIAYQGILNFNRYNEPLSDRVVLERLREARATLPRATFRLYTNGDYLTRPYLDELCAAGLNDMTVMTYLGNDDPFVDTEILTRMFAKARELGLECRFRTAIGGVRYTARLAHPDMKLRIDARNFAVVGTDRGKLVPMRPYVRTGYCATVFEEVYVDWNGCVVPCCNIRSDAPEHSGYVVDDLSAGRSIFEAYAASPLVDWRRRLFNFDPKPAPCDTCHYELPDDTPEARILVEKVSRAFGASE